MKKYLRHFKIDTEDMIYNDDLIDKKLEKRGITAEDIISITLYHEGPYETYTIWYRSEKK